MPLPEAEAAEVTRLYLSRIDDLVEEGGKALAEAWDNLGSYDETDILRLARRAGPALEVISQEAAATTSGYLAVLLEEAPLAATDLVEADWRGPFTRYWGALGRDDSLEQALESGRSRAQASGQRAVISTARRTGALVDDRVAGWRRVPSASACTWCRTVAGQRYHTAASADFGHDRCSCGVTPILT